MASLSPRINLLLEIARSHPLVLEKPAPTCLVASISKETILYLRPWCDANVYEEGEQVTFVKIENS